MLQNPRKYLNSLFKILKYLKNYVETSIRIYEKVI